MKKKKGQSIVDRSKTIYSVYYFKNKIFKVEIDNMEIIPLIAELFREKWTGWQELVEFYEGKIIYAYLCELARAITAIAFLNEINIDSIKKTFSHRNDFLNLDGSQHIKLIEVHSIFIEKFDIKKVDIQEVPE